MWTLSQSLVQSVSFRSLQDSSHHADLLCRQVRNAHSRVCPKGEQEGRAFDDDRVWNEDTKELSVRLF